MRFVFIQPPDGSFDTNPGPRLSFTTNRQHSLGLISIASYLRNNGHEAFFVDGYCIGWLNENVRQTTYDDIVSQTCRLQPDVIGLSILTSQVNESMQLAKTLRRCFPEKLIIAGGAHPSNEPEVTLEQIPELDGICLGPGEEACLEIANGSSIAETLGFACMKEGKFFYAGKRSLPSSLDYLSFPAFDLLDTQFYTGLNCYTSHGFLTRSLGMMATRGCVAKCYFCCSHWNSPLRFHSVDYVIEQCRQLVTRYPHVDTINFYDVSIAANQNWLIDFCQSLLRFGLNKRFNWTVLVRADQIDYELLKLMREAGCILAMFGLESGSDRILKLYNKRVTVEQSMRAAQDIHRAGIALLVSTIFGAPGETLEEMAQTINLVKQLPIHHLGYGRFCPLPGSKAYDDMVSSGDINPRAVDWELLSNYSRVDGPCYADVEPEVFRDVLRVFGQYCYDLNISQIAKVNDAQYPEVVKLILQRESGTGTV